MNFFLSCARLCERLIFLALLVFFSLSTVQSTALADEPAASISRPVKYRDKDIFASDRPAKQEAKPATIQKASYQVVASPVDSEAMPIDLPTALRLVDVANPTINLARERVREAYARLDQAQVLLLPDLKVGPAYVRHDGQLQNAGGVVFGVSKSNLFAGGGALLSVDLSDAFFAPLVAQRLVDAQSQAARAVSYNVQLAVALAYLDLLHVHGQLAVNEDTLRRAQEMLKNAEVAAKPGIGLSKFTSDVTRARAEVASRLREKAELEGDAGVASARLAQLLLLRPSVDLRPAEPTVVPITLVPNEGSFDEMVATGLLNRPELAESRELVAASVARWRQARLGPLIPHLDLGYAGGTFGGGINSTMDKFNGRSDGLAQMTWELHNFGAGDVARARERRSQVNQANLHVMEVEAQVGAEVTAAAKTARSRLRSLNEAQTAVAESLETWRRLRAASFGMAGKDKLYDALEPLTAEQALAQARTQYLDAVIEYNRAQFRLYTAMGQPPAEGLPGAVAEKVKVPAVPVKTPKD